MMNQSDNSDQQDAADALAKLASDQQAEPAADQAAQPAPAGKEPAVAEPLEAEVAGAEPAGAAPGAAPEGSADDPPAQEDLGEIELEDEPLMAEAVLAAPEGAGVYQAKRARQAALSGQQLKAKALFLRKTMIPILLVVGGLLLGIGVISIAMVTGVAPEDVGTSNRGLLIVVAVLSFPLAASLFFGAWWFKRELARDS